ncbi:MAG: dipicolinate synthase subunit B [Lachnospiraceae bacterium]
MDLQNLRIGIGMTGSFCSFSKIYPEIENMIKQGAGVIPIISEHVAEIDSRFGEAQEHRKKLESITGNPVIDSIVGAEPIGPKDMLDVMVIAPCTGNTLAKLVNGITDTTVLMAAKSHLRVGKPLVICLATNDALGANFKNIGQLFPYKNIYFVPFGQDNWKEKPYSMVANTRLLADTIRDALDGKQIQPVIQSI